MSGRAGEIVSSTVLGSLASMHRPSSISDEGPGPSLAGTPLLFWTHLYKEYIQNMSGVPGRRGPVAVYHPCSIYA